MIFALLVPADGSNSIFIGCGVRQVAQSSTAGDAWLIAAICSEKNPSAASFDPQI